MRTAGETARYAMRNVGTQGYRCVLTNENNCSKIEIGELTDDEKLVIKAYREIGLWGRFKSLTKKKGKPGIMTAEKDVKLSDN